MPDTATDKCIDATLGRFLEDAVSGRLDSEDRDADRQVFERHMRECGACRKSFVTHLADTTIPVLREVARKKGVSLEDLLDSLRHRT